MEGLGFHACCDRLKGWGRLKGRTLTETRPDETRIVPEGLFLRNYSHQMFGHIEYRSGRDGITMVRVATMIEAMTVKTILIPRTGGL